MLPSTRHILALASAVAIVAWLATRPLDAQSPADPRVGALASLIEQKMREYQVPGVALGILQDDRVTVRGFGVTSVEDPLPVTAHTVFPIASISKTMATVVMLRLVEQGRVDLEAPVRRYLPDFRVSNEAVSREVTIADLLTHASGWEGQIAPSERGEETLTHFVAGMRDLMQLAPPRAVWSYNNAGFSVAGRVIEAVTGLSINAAVRELAFDPIGLEHAGTTAGEFITYRFALGHASRRDGGPLVQRPFAPSRSVTAGGVGLCITDLLAYARFHLGDGTTSQGERVLTRRSLELMRTPQLAKQSTDDEIGLGWHLRTVGGLRTASHGGTLAGHVLLLELVAERSFAIGLLTNANNGWRLIQDVERAALASWTGASFAPNQAIAHRGLVETLPQVEPLARQPDVAPYLGRYVRPMNAVVVREEGRRLVVQVLPASGGPQPPQPIAFFGPDRAVVTDGPERGQGIEFIRDVAGQVMWVRVVGRIAVRER